VRPRVNGNVSTILDGSLESRRVVIDVSSDHCATRRNEHQYEVRDGSARGAMDGLKCVAEMLCCSIKS
jgi:hypothetical protein